MSALVLDVEPIDRLSEKVKGLISILERNREELAQTVEENVRLSQEIEQLRAQLATTDTQGVDLSSLLAERDQIRARVGEMLEQLESISV